jgi:hypothetical protein
MYIGADKGKLINKFITPHPALSRRERRLVYDYQNLSVS